MKRFLPAFAALSLSAAFAFPASAEVASPTVREGDFYCFRDMPASQINRLPAREKRPGTILRVDKLGNSKYDNTDGHDLREINVEGSPRILVLLVEFQDVKFQRLWGEPHDIVNEFLNSDNYTFQGATGSVRDYYTRVSRGQFTPQFDLYGPVTVSKKEIEYVTSNPDDTYYDEASGKNVACYPASRMVEEAIKGLDDQINFADYDLDGDGFVDFVYLFFAGQGATTGGGTTRTIWPHAFTLTSGIGTTVQLDGVEVNRYCTSSELGSNAKLSGIGTFCHEFGHVLGFPDLYDTANNTGTASKIFTPGSFDNMDAGNYNNNEHTPPMLSSYEQYAMEWMKPSTLSGTGRYTLLPLEARSFAYQVPSTTNPQDYFMLEARGDSFLDEHLPGKGLLVWHIDFDLSVWQANCPNNLENHQRIDIVEADNSKTSSTRDGDTFPGVAGVCEFTKSVNPTFKDWNNKPVGYDLKGITTNYDGTVEFNAIGAAQIDPKAVLKEVEAKAVLSAPNEVTLEWKNVENAEGYYISVFDNSRSIGSTLKFKDFAPGYYFKNIGMPEAENGVITIVLPDLPANKELGINIYAVNEHNASRMSNQLVINTIDPENFEAAKTNLTVGSTTFEGEAIAEWDDIESADSYILNVVTRAPGEVTSESKFDFTGSSMPTDWEGTGSYDNRKYGAAAPSYCLNAPQASLTSKLYNDEIRSISFWALKRYADDGAKLSVIALDAKGNPTLVDVIDDATLTKTGSNFNLDMPAGTHGVKFAYTYTVTELYCYLDDITLTFHKGHVDTDAPDAVINMIDRNAAEIKGLANDVDYIAYVTPKKADGTLGVRSSEVKFRVNDIPVSGVDEVLGNATGIAFTTEGLTVIPSDVNTAYDIYATDGTTIATGVKGACKLPARGIYILRSGNATAKIRL